MCTPFTNTTDDNYIHIPLYEFMFILITDLRSLQCNFNFD